MSTVIGFTVACSSPKAPGQDAVGDFTFRLSLRYGTNETVYVDIPVRGKPNGTAPPGDDTQQVAESASKAISSSSGLTNGQKGKISVQTDQGGPGNTLGRIVIDDPSLKAVDAACDDMGKLQIALIFTGTRGAPGGASPGPKSPGGRVWRTRRTRVKLETPPERPGTGNKYQWYLDSGKPWGDALVLVGVKGAIGTTGVGMMLPYLEGLVGESSLWLPIVTRVVPGSPGGQASAIAAAMNMCGIDCEVIGSTVTVKGILGSEDSVIGGIGYQTAVIGGVGRNPWEIAVGSDGEGHYGISVRPSTLGPPKAPRVETVGLMSVLEVSGTRPMQGVQADKVRLGWPAGMPHGERRATDVHWPAQDWAGS